VSRSCTHSSKSSSLPSYTSRDHPFSSFTLTGCRRIPLLTNAALCALRTTPPQSTLAVILTTRALNVPDLSNAEKGKALYRRALGYVGKKDDAEAEKDLKEAQKLVGADAGVEKALKDVETRRKERKEKERKAYGKMFG
jgi:peptidyl-prolyl isomerase D